MSNKKQSSVKWLIEQVKKEHPFWTDIFEQAKAMHKEEIITTYVQGWTERFSPTGTAKNYYTKTFGGDNE